LLHCCTAVRARGSRSQDFPWDTRISGPYITTRLFDKTHFLGPVVRVAPLSRHAALGAPVVPSRLAARLEYAPFRAESVARNRGDSMDMHRRAVLRRMSTFAAAAALWRPDARAASTPAHADSASAGQGQPRPLRKIATEEAFTIPELLEPMQAVLERSGTNLDLTLLRTIYTAPPAGAASGGGSGPAGANRDALARLLLPQLLDIDSGRIRAMDASGVAMHVLSLFMPGVQLFARDTATALARVANDRLSDAIRRHPTRFAGLKAEPRDHDERCRRSPRPSVLHRQDRDRPHHVGRRLSGPADGPRRNVPRIRLTLRRGAREARAPECGAHLPHRLFTLRPWTEQAVDSLRPKP
jgi:hypothetical protein